MEIIKIIFFGIALIVATIVLSPAAYAVTADNVKCKQCVGTSDIKKAAVTNNRLRDGAVTRSLMKEARILLRTRFTTPILHQGVVTTGTQMARMKQLQLLFP